MSISDVNNIRNSNQWELQKLHQLTADDKKTELNNNEWMSYDIELNEQMKNTNADTVKFDQDENTADVFDSNDAAERWKKIHSFNKIISQEKVLLISKNDNIKKCQISDSVAW